MLINKAIKNLGRLCVLGVVVAGPWRNGAFEPQYLRVLMWLTIASAVFALLGLWTTPSRERKVNSYWASLFLVVAPILGLVLGAFQVQPLSDTTLSFFSPHIVETRRLLFPPETEATVELLHEEGGEEFLSATEEKIGELTEDTREYNSQIFTYDEGENPDVARGLIVDSAVENTVLPESQRIRLQEWGHTISVYPVRTRQTLPMFWTAVVLFLSSSVLFNTNESRRFLFKTVVFTGLLVALACIALKANPSLVDYERFNLWWLIDCGDSFGPYVNKNAAGGYLVLEFGACLYFVAREFITSSMAMRKEFEERRREQKELEKETVYRKNDDPLWKVLLGDVFELFNRRLFFWLCVLGVLYAAILASMSRGASLAATLAFVVAVLAMFLRHETRRFWYVPLTVFFIAFGALIAVSMRENVNERMSTLVVEDEQGDTAFGRDSRWENWQAALKTSKDYPWFGSGLGTYRIANSANDQATKYDRLFFYAENTFVQTMLEMGRVGLILIVLEYVLLFYFIGRYLRGRHSIETSSFAISGVAIILGQTISSFVDFGIYLPANLFLFTLLCGASVGRQNRRLFESLAIASASQEARMGAVRKTRVLMKRERVGLIVFSLLLAGVLTSVEQIFRENADFIERRDLLRASEFTEDKLIHMSPNSVDSLIRDLKKYISRRDDSCEVRNALSTLKALRFRLQYREYLKASRPDATPEELWAETVPELYLVSFLDFQWRGMKIPSGLTRNNEYVTKYLKDSVPDLLASRRICPIRTNVYSSLMGLVPLCVDLTWDEERDLADLYARRSAVLAPFDSGNYLATGYRLGLFKLWALERRFLKKVVEYNVTFTPQVLRVMGESMPEPLLVTSINETIPDDPRALCRSINALLREKESPLFKALEQRCRSYFTEKPEQERDTNFYYWSGYFFYMLGEYESALDQLEKAYELDNTNDDAFFLRVQILCDRSSVLNRDEECVRILEEYCADSHGQKLWRATEFLEKARNNLKQNNARLDARERIRKEREMDERIKNEIKEGRSTTSGQESDVSGASEETVPERNVQN